MNIRISVVLACFLFFQVASSFAAEHGYRVTRSWDSLSAEEQLIGKKLARSCYLGCHRAAKYKIPETVLPLIEGFDAQYFINQWHDFDGERTGALASQMKLMVYSLPAEQREIVSLFYGQQTMDWAPNPDVVASEAYARGEEKYIEQCEMCHGKQGASTIAKYPPLKGQSPGYLFKQMIAFRDKQRGNRGGPIMQAIAALQSEEDWKDMIAYVSGQFYVPVPPLEFITGIGMPPVDGFVLPDTGQIQDFTDTFGEDNDYTQNPPSYSISDSGKITIDNNTKLMWEHEVSRKWMQSAEVKDYCANLELDGYDDWRLPLMKELQSIADYGEWRPAINMDAFRNVPRFKSGIWTFPASDHPENVWHIGFPDGHVMSQHTFSEKMGLCVRADNGAAYHANDFHDNGDGTVTDGVTGRMWQQKLDYKRRVWEDALQYCENLQDADYDDWRLPNFRELISIVNYNKTSPSIDEEFFPDTPFKAFFWSSTSSVGGALKFVRPLPARKMNQDASEHKVRGIHASQAWAVDYQIGSSIGQDKNALFWTRCIRNPG